MQQYEGTVIAVTHDRYFLDHVAGWILELDRGEGIPWKGNYSGWLEQKTKRMAMEEKQESKRRKTLERELEWVRMAPKARQAKGKARLNSYDKLLNEDVKEKEEKLEIFIPNGPRLGNKVIEAMAEAGIATNVHYKPIPMHTAYKKLGFTIDDYPNAYDQFKNEITLPLHTLLTDEEVQYIIEQFKRIITEC